jgi:hypothetical protein
MAGGRATSLAGGSGSEPLSVSISAIKIGVKVVSRGRYVTFQMAEVAVPRQMFHDILRLIARLWAPPAPA